MDVASWLRSLGLEQYEATFRDNAIDDSVLPDLTDQDLEKLGILLGHRRKLLRAIANIDATAQTASSAVGATVAVDVSPRDTAERRQVTVMFSDLVGSTALSARMDPEDLREVISSYQKCVAETVQRFGGFVAKYMGDGVLVYFGYPQEMKTIGGGLLSSMLAGRNRQCADRIGCKASHAIGFICCASNIRARKG
jgi:class 3 adenylate cyclase